MKTYKVENVKCGGCANTLKTKLADEFGAIEVNLELTPREITLDIQAEQEGRLREALKSLGYPMSDETLNFIETNSVKAKSYISCAVGKFEVNKK